MKQTLETKSDYNEFADYFMDDLSNNVGWFFAHLLWFFQGLNMEKEIGEVIRCLLRFSEGLLPTEYTLTQFRLRYDFLKETK
jgi:hypothetical protein